MENKDFRSVILLFSIYRQAGKTYYLITIGNAAWPIGVTATGIYERSSRERITQESVGRIFESFCFSYSLWVLHRNRLYH